MGIFSKIISGLKKTKQAIGFKLQQLFKVGVFNDEFYEDLYDILISSDVGAEATEEIVDRLRDKMQEERATTSEKAYALLKEVLMEILGSEKFEYEHPSVILVVGVNGVGKTTTIGKLASKFKKEGKSVVIAAADTFRAAAGDQLSVWAERAGVRLIQHAEGADPAAVVFDAVASAKSRNTDVLLIDTAGRLHNKKNLMEELKKINRVVEREFPQASKKNVIVLDATTGQNALTQVEIFNEAIELDGIVLTKLDGTAKGGVVLSISATMEIPVWFVGVGEGVDDLMDFDAASFVDGIL